MHYKPSLIGIEQIPITENGIPWESLGVDGYWWSFVGISLQSSISLIQIPIDSDQYPCVPTEKWEFAQFPLNIACSAKNITCNLFAPSLLDDLTCILIPVSLLLDDIMV